MNTYPRVLILTGEPFNYESATGITMSNLFANWPIDRIAQIYSAKIQPKRNICNNYWKLSNSDLYFIAQFMRFAGKKNPYSKKNINDIEYGIRVKKNAKQSWVRKWLAPWIDLIPYHLSPEFLHWVEDFHPDILYSTLGSIRLAMAARRISTHLSIPIVPHFMDDWMTTYSVQGKTILTSLQRGILRNITGNIIKKMPFGLTICDAMAKEYSKRYRRHFDVFMNPVEVIQEYPVSKKEMDGSEKPVRFVYIGGMHLSRYINLKEIGIIISNLRKVGQNMEFHIYAPNRDVIEYGSLLTLENSVRVCGTLSPNDVQKVLCEYDVAVHVESFSKKHSIYTRLSLSTKIPQYFAVGLPILAYGPADVASCKYIGDKECGTVVGRQDSEALSDAIHELASNPELRLKYGKNSWNVAKEHHDIHKEQERFRNVLLEAISGNVL